MNQGTSLAHTTARYSRAHPSPRYQELTQFYSQMHVEGERFLGVPAEHTFPGQSLPPQATRIKSLIENTAAKTLLDYGAGKGIAYRTKPIDIPNVGSVPSLQAYWGIESITCYDPCYIPFSLLPEGRFDIVICTDVLEHCPEDDVDWIIEEIFAFAQKAVFANVACFPAKKRLPNGENAHCTIKPAAWWNEKIRIIAARYPAITYDIYIATIGADSALREDRLTNMA